MTEQRGRAGRSRRVPSKKRFEFDGVAQCSCCPRRVDAVRDLRAQDRPRLVSHHLKPGLFGLCPGGLGEPVAPAKVTP